MLDLKAIEAGIKMIAKEKQIEESKIKEIIESALKTAYKKDYSQHKDEVVNVNLNFETYKIDIEVEKTIVKEVENPGLEISFEELGDDAEGFSEGDIIELDVTDEVMKDGGESFGRIASQAARQVIIQKLGDTEKEKIYDLFKDKQGQLVHVKVEMVEGGKVIFDYQGNQVILPKSEQVSRDSYSPQQRYFLYVAEIIKEENTPPRVVLSRKRKELIPLIFAEHAPEIDEGVVEIDRVVRVPGVKTKMLVSSAFPEIDPVGTLIGQKGIRVKAVMDEIGGEKIDIIPNSSDVALVIKKSLSPATVISVDVNEEDDEVTAYIQEGDRARAVGKNGLNVNLASQLTGYRINIEEVKEEKVA
ncbi:MAG: transcription termination factor NusA [Candidatus Gracilibacteria bacterium]|nr:transcription termination factor NusA [Candidatus Gracilibacteria bacterium]MDQ7022243.1 transcription termination factor NusA [Candidatus Gracilibacteria bacterium]